MIYNIKHDEMGREVANQERVALPAGWDRPLTLDEQLKRLVRIELSRQAESQGFESFEEADDFDISDDEGEFVSPYEIRPMTPYEGQEDPDGPDKGGGKGAAQKTAPEASSQAVEASAPAVVPPVSPG